MSCKHSVKLLILPAKPVTKGSWISEGSLETSGGSSSLRPLHGRRCWWVRKWWDSFPVVTHHTPSISRRSHIGIPTTQVTQFYVRRRSGGRSFGLLRPTGFSRELGDTPRSASECHCLLRDLSSHSLEHSRATIREQSLNLDSGPSPAYVDYSQDTIYQGILRSPAPSASRLTLYQSQCLF